MKPENGHIPSTDGNLCHGHPGVTICAKCGAGYGSRQWWKECQGMVAHSPDCDTLDIDPGGIQKPCNCAAKTTRLPLASEGMSLGERAKHEAQQWEPFTQNHDPSLWRALRNAYAAGFMRGFNACASMKAAS